jgi:hypothetical protein
MNDLDEGKTSEILHGPLRDGRAGEHRTRPIFVRRSWLGDGTWFWRCRVCPLGDPGRWGNGLSTNVAAYDAGVSHTRSFRHRLHEALRTINEVARSLRWDTESESSTTGM